MTRYMNVKTRNSGGVVSPLAGYKLVVTIDGASVRISAKRKLKGELKEVIPPIIEYRKIGTGKGLV